VSLAKQGLSHINTPSEACQNHLFICRVLPAKDVVTILVFLPVAVFVEGSALLANANAQPRMSTNAMRRTDVACHLVKIRIKVSQHVN
jgi:hypothetical protein